jgi:hypothetical protein
MRAGYGPLSVQARIFTLRPFANFIFSSASQTIRLPSSEGRGACVRRSTDGVCLQPISAQEQCAHDLKFMRGGYGERFFPVIPDAEPMVRGDQSKWQDET